MELVSDIIQVIKNIKTFSAEIRNNLAEAQDIINNCQYFVEFGGEFASAKYAGLKDINIAKYQQYRNEDNKNFHTAVTQRALGDLGLVITDDPELQNKLKAWSLERGLNVRGGGPFKIFSVKNIIPFLVSTTTAKEEAEKDYNKANFELVARPRFKKYFPEPKVQFTINIADKSITVDRQNGKDIVIGKCAGGFINIRDLVMSCDLKRNDTVYLKVIKEKSEYEMIFDDRGGDTVPVNDNKEMFDIIEKGLNDFQGFVKQRGFSFSDEILTNYIYSLKTKPFVILSGISGTGKTKIAQLFAEFMCPDEEVEVVQEVSESDDGFIYEVYKYFIKHSRIVLQNKIADLLQTPLDQGPTDINIRFDGIEGKCRLGYANKSKSKHILFRGEIRKYVKDYVNEGDFLKIYIENNGDEETVVFEKINAEKKKIKKRSDRYSFISVRPDWTDNRNMLGFYNPITETYQPTELLKLMLRASQDTLRPYFVILDEMNLAKVEHYFSDFLSCLESRRFTSDGKIRGEALILHDAVEELSFIDEDGTEYTIPKRLEVPLNIYFTGTVNVDETTYMFSPKVLDRANVIEFNELDMDSYQEILFSSAPDDSNSSEYTNAADISFVNYFTDHGEYILRLLKKEFNSELIQYYEKLKELNNILADYHLHFGYRVIDEIMMYLTYGYEYNPKGILIDMDLQILQKVLPKLYGNRKQLEIPLARLLRFCFGVMSTPADAALTVEERKYLSKYDYKEIADSQYDDNLEIQLSELKSGYIEEGYQPIFPRSARKLYRMIVMLERQGYTSFIE